MTASSAFRSDRAARAFVAATWILMVAICALAWIRSARNIPITEDWLLVSGLTDHDPHFWRSLWVQNNEHRVPFPQLVLQGVLRLGGGDFRVGMIFNVAIIAAMAAALIHLARTVRGRASYADAFFPIALLHLGNWENLFWSWQATQIIPVLLGLVILYLLIRSPALATVGAATVAALSLVALPLSGANGLFFVPFFGAWFCYCAWRQWRLARPAESRVAPTILVCGSVAAAILAGLYFVGYERPQWVPPNPGPVESLAAGVRFLALGWGPVARSSWILSGLGVIGMLAAGVFVCLRRVRDLSSDERHRALGLLAFTGAFGLFGLVVGWGRAGVIVIYGSWPIRYSLIALPALVVSFFLWTLYATPRRREWIPGFMAAVMVILLPLNTVHGFWWESWYREGTGRVLAALRAGADATTMVARYRKFLHHSRDPVDLANEMVMLKVAGMGPWVALPDDPSRVRPASPRATHGADRDGLVTEEIRYHRAGATKAVFGWGVDGWAPVPPDRRPPGTEIRNRIMQSPMVKWGDDFIVLIRMPWHHPLQYGFLATNAGDGREVWDGGYEARPNGDGVIAVTARRDSATAASEAAARAPATTLPADTVGLVPLTIRYPTKLTSEAIFVWGINGWNTVPRAVRPDRTTIEKNLMRTRMTREGGDLVARIDAPAGATLDYGVTLVRRPGLFDFVTPVWDGAADHPVVEAGKVIRARSAPSLPDFLGEAMNRWRAALAAMLGFGLIWAALFIAFGQFDRRRAPPSS